MHSTNPFLVKFASSSIAALGCHDRVIFKGHLPFSDEAPLNRFVDHSLRIRRKDFLDFVQEKSELLVQSGKDFAARHDAPYLYLQGRHRKEDLVGQRIRERRLSEGLVCVLCCQETCRTVKLRYGDGRPRLVFTGRPQRVLYFYFLDRQFGLRYIRVQTWFPFTTQVYVNGHDWLARQLQDAGQGFVLHDNAFTQRDDPAQAQNLADRFARLGWVKILDRWARQVNPLLGASWLKGQGYYWVIDQAETLPGGVARGVSYQRVPQSRRPNAVVRVAGSGHPRAPPPDGPRVAAVAPAAGAPVDSESAPRASLPRDDKRRSGEERRPLCLLQSVSQRTPRRRITITRSLREARKSHRLRL
jgi:hypothetical protein